VHLLPQQLLPAGVDWDQALRCVAEWGRGHALCAPGPDARRLSTHTHAHTHASTHHLRASQRHGAADARGPGDRRLPPVHQKPHPPINHGGVVQGGEHARLACQGARIVLAWQQCGGPPRAAKAAKQQPRQGRQRAATRACLCTP
jgi:hypothetical protein